MIPIREYASLESAILPVDYCESVSGCFHPVGVVLSGPKWEVQVIMASDLANSDLVDESLKLLRSVVDRRYGPADDRVRTAPGLPPREFYVEYIAEDDAGVMQSRRPQPDTALTCCGPHGLHL